MFQIPERRDRKRRLALLGSFLLHCGLVIFWLYRPPVFVKPSSIAWGLSGKTEKLVYCAPPKPEKDSTHKLALQFKATPKTEQEPPAPTESARAGTSTGSMYQSPVTGTEARPALPVVFPDPTILPWQLPNGLQGDVIVEVTIDTQGLVTDTKVLQSLKPEIDEKVLATLRSWRFRPATVDGVAISSRQDVHFHFPS
jgi:TonB family protein